MEKGRIEFDDPTARPIRSFKLTAPLRFLGRGKPPAVEPIGPYKCPVCEGRGDVPCNFYTGSTVASDLTPEVCRSCKGDGVLWS